MRKGEVTRQAVLDEAVELASQVGLAGVTIGSLAERVQMSKSGLFAHFQSKEALQLAILTRARERFSDATVRPALAAPRGEPRIRELVDRWIQIGHALSPAGCLFVMASHEFADRPGPVRDQVVAAHRDMADVIAQIFRTGVAEGHFRADVDPDQFAHDLYGVMLALYHAHRLLGEPTAEERTRAAFESLLLHVRS